MKLSKFLIIFTTIIFMLVISLLPALALDTELTIINVELYPTHVISYYGIEVYDNYQDAIDGTLWPTIELPSNHQDYDNYIVFELIDASGNANLQEDYYDQLVIEFSPLTAADATVNRLQFRFSLIGSRYETAPRIGFMNSAGAVPTSDYTISFTKTDNAWIEEGPTQYYTQFYCDVLFTNNVDLTQGISLLCDYDFINPNDHEYFQIMGCDNPKVSYSSIADYVSDISTDMKVLTDLTVENNEVLNEIVSSLNPDTSDLDAALEDASNKISDINGIQSDVHSLLDGLLHDHLDNAFDAMDTAGMFMEDSILLLEMSGFLDVWFAFWNINVVYVFVVIALGFSIVHFYLYKLS